MFIDPPVNFGVPSDYKMDHPITGPLVLASICESKGYSVVFFDNRDRFWTLDQLIRKIEKETPKIIGISSLTSNIRGAVQLAKSLKEKFKNEFTIVLGGPHISADPTFINRFPYFNIGIAREADITFPKIADRIIKNGEKVKGFFSGEMPVDLDKFPFPARHLIDWPRYPAFRTHNILASRGCPFKCIFCSIPAIEKKTRYRSPKLLVEEMRLAYRYTNTKYFTFIDDTLTLNREYMLSLCNEMIKQGMDFKWEGQTRADLVDDQLLAKMKRAGCYELSFGVESGNERIRKKIINKKIKDSAIGRTMELCYKHRILADYYLMLGFPEEGKKEVEDTVNFPFKYRWKPNIFGIHITLPLPGSIIYEQAIREKKIPPDVIDRFIKGEYGPHFNESWPYYTNEQVPLSYLKNAVTRAYKKFYFRLPYFWHRLKTDWHTGWRIKQDFIKAKELLVLGRARDDE